MVHKASYTLAFSVCWFLLVTMKLCGADSTKAKDWIEQLRHPNPTVRVLAATKLAELGELGDLAPSAIAPLSACLQDSNANVRLYACFALGRIQADSEQSMILLIPILADRDEHVRYSAEWSIAEIAKRISVREITDEDSRRLTPVFESAERELSKTAIQERHFLAVKLARTRLQNHSKQTVTPNNTPEPQSALTVPLPPASFATEQKNPPASTNSLDATLSLYKANDFVGRLQIVENMARESEFDDNLRLAILKYELQSEYSSSVATYAIARWSTSAQRLLFQLFSEQFEGEWDEAYAQKLISRLSPFDSWQLEPLCKIAVSTERSHELRLASLNALQSAISNPNLATSISQITPYLIKIAADPMESDELRCVTIEAIGLLKTDTKAIVPTLIDLFAKPELSAEVREATATAIARLSPESTQAAGAIALSMSGLQTEDSLFASLATSLGEFGPSGVVGIDRLVEGLQSKEELTRQNCVQSLGKMGQSASRVASSLVFRILDPNESIAVKSFAANAIQRMGQDAVQLLSEQLRNSDAVLQEHVLRALSQASNSTPSFLTAYVSILLDINEEELVRAAAATAIGSLGQNASSAIPTLLEICDKSQPNALRAASLVALARIAPEQAVDVIQNGINDKEPLVQASAAYGLHLCGDTAASLEALLKLLVDHESESLVLEILADIGPSVVPHAIAIAQSPSRAPLERMCCVQASAAMPNAPWPAIVLLLSDDEIGDGVASLLESADLFESEKAPLLLGLLRDGHVDTATRSRIMTVIEAEGFGGAGGDEKWENTLAINQPEAIRALSSDQREPLQRSAKQSSIVPSPAIPPRATAADDSSSRANESIPKFVPTEAKNRSAPTKAQEEADRKVSVFYGTNRSPIAATGLRLQVGWIHVCVAAGLLAAMVGCFFLFPRHSNVRYAIASMIGMGTVSTVALQIIFLTGWRSGPEERLAYGGQYSEQVQYGVCEVSIPVLHQPGELESPQMFKLEITPDLEKHVVLTHVGQLDLNSFHAALQTEMDRKGKNIFVFIHGYNVSFEDAARRTGQMAYDLKFPGAPIFYSWPSQANWYSYGTDQDNIAMSTTQIRDFLLDIATRSNADTVNLIAHSMGNVGLTAALSEIEQSAKPHFNQVVLAAPDIDANTFKNEIATKIITKARRTTLYTSKTDLALIASRYFNQGDRAGDSGSQVVILDGIDTIDATAVDSSLLGHSYYGGNVTVLDDLGMLLQNQPIASRNYLKLIPSGSQAYWAFEPVLISRSQSLEPGKRR